MTVWVVTEAPLLLFLFTMMVLAPPRTLATAWDSFWVQADKISAALSDGDQAVAAIGGVRAALIVLPLAGMSITFTRVTKRLGAGLVGLARRRPLVGGVAGLALIAALAATAAVLLPNGEYRPIQPGEKWTVQEAVASAAAVGTGRPSLTEERARELGGAPTVRSGNADAPGAAGADAPGEGGASGADQAPADLDAGSSADAGSSDAAEDDPGTATEDLSGADDVDEAADDAEAAEGDTPTPSPSPSASPSPTITPEEDHEE
ncbi:MAG: hypothetical protein ABR529_15625 [Actinomycetota bacterium]